ncbi:MAG: hypothetical protein D6701_14110 [Gemmatimonadetes bacterium]|nr:MAG: hypothetical protein D6701_14110 [Gemmatimonadota bacterium]
MEARPPVEVPESRGREWGRAVHAALAAIADGLDDEALRAVVRAVLVEEERPLDDAGAPVELDELVELARAIAASELWERARAARDVLVEAPFAVELEGVGESGVRTLVEGAIDLVFREEEGWVVVDYKTDVGTDPAFPARREAYRRQVDLYAAAWSRLTGEPVVERVLVYTALGRNETW